METKRDTRPEIRSTFIDVQEGAVNMPYQYDNKENSLAAAIRKYNLEEKEQKIRLRIRKGRDPTEVFQEMQLR